VGRVVAFPCQDITPCLEVAGSSPVDSPKFYHCQLKGVPCGSPRLGHVAPFHSAQMRTCVGYAHWAICMTPRIPSHLPAQHTVMPRKLYDPATSVVRPCHVSCTDCTVIKFLPVWQNGQNVISHSYSVCLNPFELRWVVRLRPMPLSILKRF
jgi:hypothetical protein